MCKSTKKQEKNIMRLFTAKSILQLRTVASAAIVLFILASMSACTNNNAKDYEKLSDRIAIEDMIVKYYVDMSAGKSHDLAQYYTEDALLDVNGVIAKGHEEIEKLYKGVGDGDAPAFSGKMNMLLNNAIIDVNGDTATAWFIWTGVINEDIEGPPRFLEQGREFDELVKRDGRWYITKRYITADSGAEAWMETYKPRTFR
jgi:ketosteroid isomerase-like protein